MKSKNSLSFAVLLLSFLAMQVFFVFPAGAQQIAPSSKGYAPVNGVKMYYEVYGSGKPVILLHGAYMNIGMNWGELIPELSRYRKVIAVDMQGHGRTGDIDRPLSHVSLAEDVAAFIRYMKLDSADVIGYSLGGTVAFQLAFTHPALVSKLVVISSAFRSSGWTPEVAQVFKMMNTEMFDQTPLKQAYDSLAPDPKHWKAFIAKMITFNQQEFDLGVENIRKIKSPTLLIMGDNDGVELDHKAEMYKALGGGISGDIAPLPASRLAILPASAHVTLMMQTQALLAILGPFLKNEPPLQLH